MAKVFGLGLCLFAVALGWPARSAAVTAVPDTTRRELRLQNDRVRAAITLAGGHLAGERLELPGGGVVDTDGGFLLQVTWSGVQSPCGESNGDNLCYLAAEDFLFTGESWPEGPRGRRLHLAFQGPDSLNFTIEYELPESAFFLRRRLTISDPHARNHFLESIWPIRAVVRGEPTIVKQGGFGQPVAMTDRGHGAFFGLEWPAASNRASPLPSGVRVTCGEEMGVVITPAGVSSEPAVVAVTPDANVKRAFFDYLDTILVGKLRPYTLFDTWHSLRPTETPGITAAHHMTEETVLRDARLLEEKLVRAHGTKLDAFVLDEGWNKVESDWALRQKEFPRGLEPILNVFGSPNTALGLWYGPTGGYRLRDRRVAWMKAHGYECAGDQMWIGGPKYSAMLTARATEMARRGVSYFKWDGLQFTASDSGLGTIPGIYSRRVALKRVAKLASDVRKANPNAFLTMSSGTWMSPWWLQIADQVWMGGEDYAGSATPSRNLRDAIMSYKDEVLHSNFRGADMWFPMANLMTHGILKTTVDLGDTVWDEPPSKFADDAVFHLARGISLQELYIEPALLRDEEWKILADALRWARDRFSILARTEMVGGDPAQGEAYGYAHFSGKRGVVAIRNPVIAPTTLHLALDDSLGIDAGASGLVLERVFPTRWISPRVFKAGDAVDLPLLGNESAIYELRPLSDVPEPLLAGVVFEEQESSKGVRRMTVLEADAGATVLHSESVRDLVIEGKSWQGRLDFPARRQERLARDPQVEFKAGNLVTRIELGDRAHQATVGALFERDPPVPGSEDPHIVVHLDGHETVSDSVAMKGVWQWRTLAVPPGRHVVSMALSPRGGQAWSGSAQVWLTADEKVDPIPIELSSRTPSGPARPLPSNGREPGHLPRVERLGDARVLCAGR